MTVTTKPKALSKHPPPSASILIPGLMITVTIPVTPAPETSPNNRSHWRIKARARKELREASYHATRNVVVTAKTDEPFPEGTRLALTITIAWGKGRSAHDADNAIACLKGCVDGFSDAVGIDDRDFTIAGCDQVRDAEGLGWVRLSAEVIQPEASGSP